MYLTEHLLCAGSTLDTEDGMADETSQFLPQRIESLARKTVNPVTAMGMAKLWEDRCGHR